MKKRAKIAILVVFAAVAACWIGYTYSREMKPAIGILEVDGAIMGSEIYLERLKAFEEDDAIKAVVVRINSPGGVVGPSQEVYEEILKLKKKKPVIASMSAVGASGAYYIACACEIIYAMPGTMTGSIGVIMEFIDVSSGLTKLGITAGSITSGKMKDAGTPFRPMSPEEREYFLAVVNDVQDQFVEAVSKSRKIPAEKVRSFADGRIYTGRQALKLGLVDKMGGLEDAIELAKNRSGITDEPRIIRPKEEKGLFESLGRLLDGSVPGGSSSIGEMIKGRNIRLSYSMY
jgi:protease-4